MGQRFIALNGGPHFKFNEAISLAVDCDTQKEIDELWSKLTSGGGQESQCGWLKDKFGLSWQINAAVLSKMFQGKDPRKVKRAQWLLVRAMARTAFLPLALTAVPAFGLWAYLRKSASQLPPGLWWLDFAGLLLTLHALGAGVFVVTFVIFVVLF